jgi:O-antigen ligase
MFEYLKIYLFNPDRDKLNAGNVIFMVVCLTLGALIGSAVSVYVVCGVVYGTYHILRGAVTLRRDSPVMSVAVAFFAYFAAELIAAIVNPSEGMASELMSTGLFLGFLPLISLMVIPPILLLDKVEISAAVVAIAAAFIAAALSAAGYQRIELAAGNAGVLAVVASVLFLINLNAVFRQGQKYWQFGLAGSVAAVFVILLTGMRALWPVIFVLPLLMLLTSRQAVISAISKRAIAGATLAFLLVSVLAYPVISSRIAQISVDVEAANHGNFSTSIGERIVLWRAGLDLVLTQPILGYGPQNVTHVMIEKTRNIPGGPLGYSHFHNAFLNETIRAGLVGLAALLAIFIVPLVVVLKARRVGEANIALKILLGTQIIYMFSGLTGIMLGHDILDSILLCVTVFCVYLAYPNVDTATPA